MPSEFKKRAQGLEGRLYEIVATEEQKWVNLQFLWRMIASLPEGSRRAQAKTLRRKGGRKEEGRRADWEPRGGACVEGFLGRDSRGSPKSGNSSPLGSRQ